jgi:hypothetical protein
MEEKQPNGFVDMKMRIISIEEGPDTTKIKD